MAFGTGHHQTTFMMCRALLENEAEVRDKVVLDMGCGTAVLAILAAKMKASKVYQVLCICMIGSMTVYAVGDETEPVVDDTVIVEEPVVEDPNAEIYENLLAAESIDAFYAQLDALSDEAFAAFLAGCFENVFSFRLRAEDDKNEREKNEEEEP